jgi:hypothetical protein
MSSQKIPKVGLIDTGKVGSLTQTKSGILGRYENGDFCFHLPCAEKHYERVIDELHASRYRNAPQIDWGFLTAEQPSQA